MLKWSLSVRKLVRSHWMHLFFSLFGIEKGTPGRERSFWTECLQPTRNTYSQCRHTLILILVFSRWPWREQTHQFLLCLHPRPSAVGRSCKRDVVGRSCLHLQEKQGQQASCALMTFLVLPESALNSAQRFCQALKVSYNLCLSRKYPAARLNLPCSDFHVSRERRFERDARKTAT